MAKKSYPIVFRIVEGQAKDGEVSKEHLDEWLPQITSWIQVSQSKVTDPRAKAELVLRCAINGTRLDGSIYPGVETFGIESRIKMFCGYDVIKKIGREGNTARRRGKGPQQPAMEKARTNKAANKDFLDASQIHQLYTARNDFVKILKQQFPHLDNPVYESKVNALAEAEVRLKAMSDTFLTVSGKDFLTQLTIQEELRKSINDLMMMLSIHPKQLTSKIDQSERGDVGSLMVKWSEYGDIADTYEQVDAIQELIQMIHMANHLRLDGSPQLADYMLWHLTGCRGHTFQCECGKEYELYNGFSKEELEQAGQQAYKVFGFGVKKIEA